MKQILCMKWGTRYPAEYVNRLYAMVTRQTTPPFRFICMTDDAQGIVDGVEVWDCPTVDVPEPHCNRGWRKIALWDEALGDLSGQVLFLDLDLVVTGSLDDFFTYAPEATYCVMRNWSTPRKRIGNTSVYRFDVGSHPYLLRNLLADPMTMINKYRISQQYISGEIGSMTFWPDAWCRSFKTHCVPPWPQRLVQTPRLPEDARVVIFPGHPDPHEAMAGHWPVNQWPKKLYKTIRPTPWIQQHWG
jgi:hypothetical protein